MASKNDDFMGGLFDFDGDGKTDLGEEFIAYQIYEEMTKDDRVSDDPVHLKTSFVSTNEFDVDAFLATPDDDDDDHELVPDAVGNRDRVERKRKNIRKVLVACALVSILGIAIAAIVQKINNRPYEEALKLFDDGKYQESLVLLEDMWLNGSTDVVPLMDAIQAFREYDAGNVEEANRRLDQWAFARKIKKARPLPAPYVDKINVFQTQVQKEYKVLKEEKEKEEAYQAYLQRIQYQQEMADAKERLKDQFPFIGMEERFVSLTRLGGYAYFKDIERYDYPYRIYVFKDSKGRETYAVTCKNYIVSEVWDKLNGRKLTESNTWKSRGSKSITSSSKDPYNARDYSNEEDFYDDHWADFFDYYEAEAYWQEHQ